MHILILNHYAGSPYHGMVYRSYYLAKEWVKLGHSVTIVAASYSHTRNKNPVSLERLSFEDIDDIQYIWIRTRKYNGNGLGRVLNMLDYLRGLYGIVSMLISMKFDMVIASSTYLFENYPAHKISRQSHAKYVVEIRDLWPLTLIELGGYSKYHPFIMLMQRAENFAYRNADKVISLLPCAEEYMLEHGLEMGKFNYIPNGISLDELSKIDPLNIGTKEKIPLNKFIVGYTGSFGLANSLDTLIEAAAIIQKTNNNIYFVFIGDGPEKNNLLELQHRLDINNVLMLDTISKKQIQSAISLFSVSAIALFSVNAIAWNNKPSIFRFGISPNKLFDYMYAGKPIVQAIEAGNDIVRDAVCGLTIAPKNPEAIADAILELYNMPEEERDKMGSNGKEYVLQNHTYEVLAKQFLNIFE